MKKGITILSLMMLLIGLLAACGTSEQQGTSGDQGDTEKKKLVMGTSADYPPFEFIDTKSGIEKFVGLDIELAQYIADELGYELEIKDMNFDGLIGSLQSNRVDFVAACMSATEERKKNVDFSDIYYHSGEIIVTLKGSKVKSVDDLKGKKLGVQLGSIQEDAADKLAGEIQGLEVKKLNKLPELIQELKTERIDAVIIDQVVGEGYLENQKDLAGFVLETEDVGTAIAFPKDSELVDDFNKVIAEMKESGKLDEIINKWIAGEGK